MPEPIVFYDLASLRTSLPGFKPWSPNTWKTRYSLNIKGIPYKTVWVELPDVEALCLKIGAPATAKRADGSPLYTLPVIYDPTTKAVVAESAAIARYLDDTYPDTLALIPTETSAFHAVFESALFSTVKASGDFFRIMAPAIYPILNEHSKPYFRRTREAWLGAKLEEIAPVGSEKRAKHWEGTRQAWHKAAEWFKAGGDDRLLLMGGDRVCYADISLACLLVWIRVVLGEDSEEWKDVLYWDEGRWGRFMNVFRKYEAIDVGSDVEL